MKRRIYLHYGISTLLLTIYGAQVCPFIEGLEPVTLMAIVALAFAGVAGVRLALIQKFARQYLDQPLAWETALFVVTGLLLMVFNTTVYAFPLASGLKMVLGCLLLGLFAAIDIAIQQDTEEILHSQGASVSFSRPYSLASRFMAAASALTLLVFGVVTLVIFKDLKWLFRLPESEVQSGALAVGAELFFVALVFLGHSLNLFSSWGRNLKAKLRSQVTTLTEVQNGNLDKPAYSSSNDEFAAIAVAINQMIQGLKERRKISNLFGKMLSPEIARHLLADDQMHVGREKELTILFSDIRDFTSFAERNPPQQLVATLNLYHSAVAAIVAKHGGFIDKFIGDGMLAVFGFDSQGDSVEAALRASLEIQEKLRTMREAGELNFSSGIGIHRGLVIAGFVGGQERMEFTVMGDSVNVAARLESLSKETPYSILISQDSMNTLAEGLRSQGTVVGERQLKGRSAATVVYGYCAKQARFGMTG